MKCPSCGAGIGNNRACSYCGTQITAEMLQEKELLNKAGCPKCGSTKVSFKRENQGEIRGKNGKRIIHSTVGVCKDCGYTWNADGEQQVKKRKTWLWVLGWLFIFPLPLTLILLKKKDMKPVLKYGIIAAAWILFLVIGIAGNANKENPEDPSATTVPVSESEQTNNTQADSSETELPENAVTFVLSWDEAGEYGKKMTLNAGTDIEMTFYAYYIPAGTYNVRNLSENIITQVTVYSGVESDGETEMFLSDDCDRPIVVSPNGEAQTLTIKEGQFVKLSDNGEKIEFVQK